MESSTLTFRLKMLDQPALIQIRTFERDDEVDGYVRSLLAAWPKCEAIEIIQAGEVIDLFVQSSKSS